MEKKQTVWINMSPETPTGVLVWELNEVVDDGKGFSPYMQEVIKNRPETYIECRDGSYVYLVCTHHFSKKLANKSLADDEGLVNSFYDPQWIGVNHIEED